MKRLLFLLLLWSASMYVYAQEIPAGAEQQLEQWADLSEEETEDDAWVQDLEKYRRHPLDINTAQRDDLLSLGMLSALQVEHFLQYRNMLGRLVSRYELQAVPGWDLPTIRSLLPYITVTTPGSSLAEVSPALRGSQHQLVIRIGRILEKANGYRNEGQGPAYAGSPWKYFFRYRYQQGTKWQWGAVGEKDAGEVFFRRRQPAGFDFYSVHGFARQLGPFRALAIGDYTINMGQGLIHWQGLAFSKSAEVMQIKRQSPVIRPYSAAGEHPFHRGAALTLGRKSVEATLFFSSRKRDGHLGQGQQGEVSITSFNTSGYHRTASEEAGRGVARQLSWGGNMMLRKRSWQLGGNLVWYRFSLPVQKPEDPYQLFSWRGRQWWNASVDYSGTIGNLHFFGEVAGDRNRNGAVVHGALVSVSPAVDVSVVHRHISPRYQSVNGNAFTENTQPVNERGLFLGVALRPAHRVRMHFYTDIFYFPWLKFRVDAPSRGAEYMVQVFHTPSKQVEWYTTYRVEIKDRHEAGNSQPLHTVIPITRQSWRSQFSVKLNDAFTIRQRTELLWYDRKGVNPRQGYLLFSDIIYRPPLRPLSAVLRLASFETGDYDTRVYAYENDVLYSFSIPALYGRGYRYYITLGYDLDEHWSAWLRVAATDFPGQAATGSGWEQVRGGRKTEIKCQARWQF